MIGRSLLVFAFWLFVGSPGMAKGADLQYGWTPGQQYGYEFQASMNARGVDVNVSGACVLTINEAPRRPGTPETIKGSGTGFAISSDGYLVTCAHVVEGATTVQATINNQAYAAQVVGLDKAHDLAVLKIPATGLTPAPLADSDKVELNEDVLVVGFPLSTAVGESIKMSRGIVAGIIKDKDKKGGKDDSVFQVDAAINPGNSGGPVVNMKGHVIGVASAKLVGEDVSNIGFAVPARNVSSLLGSLKIACQMGSGGEDLQGAALGRKIQPSVAFLSVTVDLKKLGGEKRLITYKGHITESIGSAAASQAGSGDFVVSLKGDVSEEDHKLKLPPMLGSISDLIVDDLPSDGKTTWQVVRLTTVAQLVTVQTPGSPRPPSPGMSSSFSRSSRGHSRYQPRSAPSAPPRTSTQAIVYPALERYSYEIVSSQDPIVTIKRRYELVTVPKPGQKPFMQTTTDAVLKFNTKIGAPDSLVGEGAIEINENSKSDRVAFKFGHRRVDPASYRAPGADSALASKSTTPGAPGSSSHSKPTSSSHGAASLPTGSGNPPGALFGSLPPASAQKKATRLKAPDEAGLTKARQLVDKLFAKELASLNANAKKLEFVQSLLDSAREESNDMTARYALLDKARTLASEAGDLSAANGAIDEMVRQYEIDGSQLRIDALSAAQSAADKPDKQREFIDAALKSMDEAIKSDHLESARRMGSMAMATAKALNDAKATERVLDRGKQFKAILAEFNQAKSAIETLRTNSDDPAANYAAGRFACMVKGDWDAGLPMLAKGADEAMKSLAAKELAGPITPDDQVEVADAWYDRGEAESGMIKDVLLAHASIWYDRALPGLSGLQRVKAEKRIVAAPPAEEAKINPANLKSLLKMIAAEIKANHIMKTKEAGLRAGAAFSAAPETGGVLIGLEISAGADGVHSLKPVFQTDKRVAPGAVVGMPDPKSKVVKLMAKKGYAIGAIQARSGIYLEGIAVTFMEIGSDGLNPQKSYNSDWVGGKGGTRETILGANGMPVIGVYGHAATDKVQSLGLFLTSKQ